VWPHKNDEGFDVVFQKASAFVAASFFPSRAAARAELRFRCCLNAGFRVP
jgi:hypothetical protein